MLYRRFFYGQLFAAVLLFISINVSGQSVAINTDKSIPDGSAMLDIKSTNKGLLPPRLTKQQIFSIVNPAAGLMVYNSISNKPVYFDGTNWRFFNDAFLTLLVNGVNDEQATQALNIKRLSGYGSYPAVAAVKWNDTLSKAAYNFAKDIATQGDGANLYTTSTGGFILNYPGQIGYSRSVYFALVFSYPSNADVTTMINAAFAQNDNIINGGFMDSGAKEFGMGYYNNRWYLIMAR